jgi:hypothetical protein
MITNPHAYRHGYVPTGILGVDMVAAAVTHYKNYWLKYQKPIKTVYLTKELYNQFTSWVRKNQTEEHADRTEQVYTFEGVEVKKGSWLMDRVYFDFYDTTKPEA